jgi:hypothetical protein
MSNFPLYDDLLKKSTNDELKSKQKDEFMKIVKNIDSNGSELIYALIRTYQLENSEDKSTFKLPYGGKFVKDDIKFDFNELPNELKNILYQFVLIHLKTSEEEGIIQENRTII